MGVEQRPDGLRLCFLAGKRDLIPMDSDAAHTAAREFWEESGGVWGPRDPTVADFRKQLLSDGEGGPHLENGGSEEKEEKEGKEEKEEEGSVDALEAQLRQLSIDRSLLCWYGVSSSTGPSPESASYSFS